MNTLLNNFSFTGDESVGSSSNKIKLNFNHPCKELIWVVQPDENVDYCASFDCEQHLFNVFGAQPFNYTDAIDALPNAFHAFGTEESLTGNKMDGEGFITDGGLFQQVGPGTFPVPPEIPSYNADGNRGERAIYPNSSDDNREWGGAAGVPDGTTGMDPEEGLQAGWDQRYTAGDINGYPGYPAVLAGVSDAGTFVLSETALHYALLG